MRIHTRKLVCILLLHFKNGDKVKALFYKLGNKYKRAFDFESFSCLIVIKDHPASVGLTFKVRNARDRLYKDCIKRRNLTKAQCAIGVSVDDHPNISALKELFIHFLNGASQETVAKAKRKDDNSQQYSVRLC
ncbi:hypothetical protein ACROYT_G015548 [Oculina patagonica]